MSDFYEGRVAATFQVGVQIENTKEAYDKEILGLEGMKAAMTLVVKSMEDYLKRIHSDRADGKIPIKEGDVALKYVGACVEQMQKMYSEVEVKRTSAITATKVLERLVADVKQAWDKETKKLKEIKEFEAKKPVDIKERPTGYMPKEHPIEQIEELKTKGAPRKRSRKLPDEGEPNKQ